MASGDECTGNGRGSRDAEPSFDATPAGLLDLLWTDMGDVLGTAATATLMRRAVRQAASHRSALGGVSIGRTGFDYRYSLPDNWHEEDDGALHDLRSLVQELRSLLMEMTGPVVVQRLERIAQLQRLGMTLREER